VLFLVHATKGEAMTTGELVVVFLLVIGVLACVGGRWLRHARLELERPLWIAPGDQVIVRVNRPAVSEAEFADLRAAFRARDVDAILFDPSLEVVAVVAFDDGDTTRPA
jgi:hypothetical protein